MELRIEDEDLIRRYLLGQLSEGERAQFETRIMTDSELYDQLLLAEDEMVEDYVENKLPAGEREAFKSSYLSTADGQKRVSFEKDLREYATKKGSKKVTVARWQQVFFGSYARLAAAAIILVGIALGIWRIFFYQSDVSKGIAALAYAYREQRPVEARITGFAYAPAANTRGGEEKVDRVARNRAERILLDEVSEHPSAASYHALGRLYLAERKLDDAVKQFEEALQAEPNNPRLHSDYGAALIEVAKADRGADDSGKRLEVLARALEHLTKALDLDASLWEALFNRALCLQDMGLSQQAADAWRDYLQKDGTSKWSDEARQYLQNLEDQKQKSQYDKQDLLQEFLAAYGAADDERAWSAISRSRDATGSFAENFLIDGFLDAATQGKPQEAASKLRALSYAAELERRIAHDQFLSDLVWFYESASPSQLTAVAEARALMKSGHNLYNGSDYEQAITSYSKAGKIFKRIGATCENLYASYRVSYSLLLQSKPDPSMAAFKRLAETCESSKYDWLLARCCSAMANAQVGFGDFSMAIRNSTRSLEIAEKSGDGSGVMGSLLQLGAEYIYLSNYEKSLSLHARSLVLARSSAAQPRQLWAYYFSIGNLLSLMNLRASAIAFQREALQLALTAAVPELIARSYNYLGFVYGEIGNYAEAINNINAAAGMADSFSDRTVGLESLAYSYLLLGDVYSRKSNCKEAIESYERADRLYAELKYTAFSYFTHKGRLLCCIAGGGCPSVEQDIEDTLALFERHRAKILEESNRNAYFDAEQSVYDVGIDFEYSGMKDARKAFEFSETSRARSLCDLINTNTRIVTDPLRPDVVFAEVSKPLNVAAIRERMPQDTQILQYAVLKNRLLIWVVSREDFFSTSENVPAEDLSQTVKRYLHTLSSNFKDMEACAREAAQLYDLLVKPVEALIRKDKQLCIVPDKFLNYLPFGALLSRESGRYFIEDHPLLVSPSASIFILCSDAAREKEHVAKERVLSVGNPRVDRAAFPALKDIPDAGREAERIAGCYESAVPITGAAATKTRVLKEMGRSDVIHLALHAVLDESSAMRSQLLLAKAGAESPSRASDDALRTYEIYKANLKRAKLVVLSACQTGVEKYFGGEGMIGISRAFIANRVPLVVASLWPVDSESAAELMINFHKYRRKESSTVVALSRAQIEMLKGSDQRNRSPYYWAPFVVIGGYAKF